MLIRQSRPEEFKMIAQHIMLAMDDIMYHFINERSEVKATQILEKFIQQQGNQYSYENCWIAEVDSEVVATALVYDGAQLHELRLPVAEEIKSLYNADFDPEDETQAGEYYIDCVGVSPNHQGKGIGTEVLKFLIKEYVYNNDKTLGLLVDKGNPDAKKLYLKLGFEVVGEKTLAGKNMEHLQFIKRPNL